MTTLNDFITSLGARAAALFANHREPADRVAGLRAFALVGRRASAPLQAWQILAGGLTVLLPGLFLAIGGRSLPVTTPGIIFIFSVALSTYLAGWTGGVTALLVSALWLDFFFLGDRHFFNWPASVSEAISFLLVLLIGTAIIVLIERVKQESAVDRREAIAARAATAALATLEASSRSDGAPVSEEQAMRLLLEAMVRANRAHGGVVFLYDAELNDFVLSASYAVADSGLNLPEMIPVDSGFAGRIALERRPAMVERLTRSVYIDDPLLACLGFESVLGVPLIADDELLGIAVTGVVIAHRFTATEAARAEAIASRTAALLRAARAGDAHALQLQRAQDARDRLSELLQTMPEAVVLVAPPDGRILLYNAAAVRLFGTLDTAGPLSDLSTRLLTPDGELAEPQTLPHIVALQTGEVVDGVELLVRLGDGRETPILASAAPLRELDREIAAVVVVFRDIRPLKEASRLREEFISVVSHELRSPMTPIRGFVQLVERDLIREGNHEQHVRWLRTISAHVDRMTRLVEDLLEVSRLRAGTLDIRLEPTDLVAVCEDVAASRQASATEHQIMFRTRDDTVIGNWDPDRLHQIVDNLVGNAIKYSPAGGVVTIDLDGNQREARLTVSDEGPGIPPEDRERIFSAFFRTREATASQISGLGLGLYIVSELVAAHDGLIEVSESPSGGAAFQITLPLRQSIAA